MTWIWLQPWTYKNVLEKKTFSQSFWTQWNEKSIDKKAAGCQALTIKTLSHMIEINIFLFRLTEQNLFTHPRTW